MSPRALVDLGLTAIDARLEVIDYELAALSAEVPGDPGVYRWPPFLDREFERLYEEQAELSLQRRTLSCVRWQVAR